MPAPIVMGAAAIAARIAAKKAAQEAAKKAAKAAAAKTAQIAKNSVKTKPARKQVGNPPNETKAWEDYIGSVSRGAPASGRSAGKSKTARVFNSKVAKKTARPVKEPARTPTPDNRPPYSYKTVEINSAKSTKAKGSSNNFVEAPIKDTKLGERSGVFAPRAVKARVPARKPANPARATVKINSAKSVRVVKVKRRKKSAAQLRPKKK
jgi:hypothetical protein